MNHEIRLDDEGGIDEVVAENCHVHLERMDTGEWSLILSPHGKGGGLYLSLSSRLGGDVVCHVFADETGEGGEK